jgi:hypothetical protein
MKKRPLEWNEAQGISRPHRPPLRLASEWCEDANVGFVIEQDPCGGFRLTQFWDSGARQYIPTNFKTVDAAKDAAERIAKRMAPTIMDFG